MSTGYEVSVDQLQSTVSKLRAVADGLEHPKSKARYSTAIAPGVLGQNLPAADSLMDAHNQMAQWLEGMISQLQDFIDTYSSQTKQAGDSYTDNEARTRQDFFAGGQ